jgi:hypothetical protein
VGERRRRKTIERGAAEASHLAQRTLTSYNESEMTLRTLKRVATPVAVVTCGLALFALAALEFAQSTVLQERAMDRCGQSPPTTSPQAKLDPHYAARSEATGWSVNWHFVGYKCRYRRSDGTVFYLPPPP